MSRLWLENASPGHIGGNQGEERRAGYRLKVWVLKARGLVVPEGEGRQAGSAAEASLCQGKSKRLNLW